MDEKERFNFVMARPGAPKGQIESFFFKVSDPAAGWGLWIRFTILVPTAPGAGPTASVWATHIAAGDWKRSAAARETYPFDKCIWSPDAVGMSVGESSFSAGHTRGKLADAFGRSLEWDIEFDTAGDMILLLPAERMTRSPSRQPKAVTPYADARAKGFFALDGDRVEWTGLPCMQGHNWGRTHVPDYAWGHCNAFDGAPGTYFEAVSARTETGGLQTPYLSIGLLKHDGRIYRFDNVEHLLSRDVSVTRDRWRFILNNGEFILKSEMASDRRNFAGLMYPNPDLTHRLCLNSNLADVNLELSDAGSGTAVARLASTRGGMLEFISPETWPDVCVYIPEFETSEAIL